MPHVTVSPGAEEPAALEGTSVTGPNTGLEGTDVAEPSSGSEGTSRSVASAGSVEMGIDGPVRALASCQRRNGLSSGGYPWYWWRGSYC